MSLKFSHARGDGFCIWRERPTSPSCALSREKSHEAREFLDDVFVKYVCDARSFRMSALRSGEEAFLRLAGGVPRLYGGFAGGQRC